MCVPFLAGFEKDSVFGYKGCPSNRILWQGVAYGGIAIQTWLPAILVFSFNALMFCKLRAVKSRRKRLTGDTHGKFSFPLYMEINF